MTRRGVVVPPVLADRLRLITWDTADEMLEILHREIPADVVGSSPAMTVGGATLRMWVADDSLLQESGAHNDRAIGLCRAAGYDVPDVCGVAVFTGGPDPLGEVAGLTDELLDAMAAADALAYPDRLTVTVTTSEVPKET